MIWQFIIDNKNIQAQLSDGLDNSQEQKYTCATDITVKLINYYHVIVTQKQYIGSRNLLLRTKYTSATGRRFGSQSRTKIHMQK